MTVPRKEKECRKINKKQCRPVTEVVTEIKQDELKAIEAELEADIDAEKEKKRTEDKDLLEDSVIYEGQGGAKGDVDDEKC